MRAQPESNATKKAEMQPIGLDYRDLLYNRRP